MAIAIAKRMLALENQIKGGTRWFFWIAGASVVNSVIFFAGGSLTSIFGLASNWYIDSLVLALARQYGSGPGSVIRVVGFCLDLFIASIFAISGVLGRRRSNRVVVIGVALYALDGIVFLAFGNWIAVIFHVIALAGLWRGLRAINNLVELEKSQSTGDIASAQKLLALQAQMDTDQAQRNRKRFLVIIITLAAVPLVVLLLMLWLSQQGVLK